MNKNKINRNIVKLCRNYNIPLVAVNNCYFLNREDYESYKIFIDRQPNNLLVDSLINPQECYFKSKNEIENDFTDFPDAIENTIKIAKMCNVELDLEKKPPHYQLDKYNPDDQLKQIAKKGLKKKIENFYKGENIDINIYKNRLEHELNIIQAMGLSSYFLIAQEYTNWAKNNNIYVGPGCYSAPSSLVAWALDITTVDPVKFNLIFERFINIKTGHFSEIAIDLDIDHLNEVINHVKDKYGKSNVANLCGYTRLEKEQALKMVKANLGPSGSRYNEKIDNLAYNIKGLITSVYIENNYLTISDKAIENYAPLFSFSYDKIGMQMDYAAAKKAGFSIFELIGDKRLAKVQETLKLIKENRNIAVNLANLPLNDKKILKLYSSGSGYGFYQFYENGMCTPDVLGAFLSNFEIISFEDIVSFLTLFRPGAIASGMLAEFIARKKGVIPITYHPLLASCLKYTYGMIIYQEQIMQIAHLVADYTYEDAYILCKTLPKRKNIEKEKHMFIEKAGKNNIDAEKANNIFDFIESFAAYAFNRAHVVSYALLCYGVDWLKVHYPDEFMAVFGK